jgi:hypothetical protein
MGICLSMFKGSRVARELELFTKITDGAGIFEGWA